MPSTRIHSRIMRLLLTSQPRGLNKVWARRNSRIAWAKISTKPVRFSKSPRFITLQGRLRSSRLQRCPSITRSRFQISRCRCPNLTWSSNPTNQTRRSRSRRRLTPQDQKRTRNWRSPSWNKINTNRHSKGTERALPRILSILEFLVWTLDLRGRKLVHRLRLGTIIGSWPLMAVNLDTFQTAMAASVQIKALSEVRLKAKTPAESVASPALS